jgi:hypothetical protein
MPNSADHDDQQRLPEFICRIGNLVLLAKGRFTIATLGMVAVVALIWTS